MWQYLVLLIISLLIYCEWRKRRVDRLSGLPESGFPVLPLWGHAYKFIGSNEARMKAIQLFGREAIKNDGVSTMWMGMFYAVVVADADMADFFLKNCLEKGDFMKFVKYFTGNGLLTASVPIWRELRKKQLPTFNSKYLRQFFNVFAKQSRVLVERLRARAGSGPFAVMPYLTAYSMDAVCINTLGVEVKAQEISGHPFLKALDLAGREVSGRMSQPWLHNDAVYNFLPSSRTARDTKEYMNQFIDQIITAKRKEMKEEPPKVPGRLQPVLELLLQTPGYCNESLRSEALVLALAGTDTAAAALGGVLHMLARWKQVQLAVVNELYEVLGNSTRPIEADDLPRLKYLEAVIKETIRLLPPVPIITRTVTKDFTLPSGGMLVKGSIIILNTWAMHRNPRHWGADAELFRPERFLDTSQHHPAQFCGFGHGPRNCIGYRFAVMSMKTVLATVLLRYQVLPATSATQPTPASHDPSLRLTYNVVMKDIDGIRIRLEPRDSARESTCL